MRLKSLRIKIAITLAFLLLVAIGLTNFVLFRIIERNIIDHHFRSGIHFITSLHKSGAYQQDAETASNLDILTVFPSFAGAIYIIDGFIFELPGSDPLATRQYATDPLAHVSHSGKPDRFFAGREWGVFWQRSKYLVVSVPLPDGSGAGAAVIELSPYYGMLRSAQQVAIGYMLLNFLALFVVGMYRFSGLFLRPILRLIRVTDNYRYSEPFDMFPEQQHDEFGRLSSSLNKMMHRIDDDRQELEQSIKQIETANRDLKKAQQEIIRAEKLASIGRLTAGIAHEIGNPISIVLGYIGLLKARSISPEDSSGMDYIARAEVEINRINNIIRQLLDFSRPAPSGFSKFSIHDLLYNTGRMLSQQPLMENIRLFFDFSATNDTVYADYNQLHQVMVNLVINAADSISASANKDRGEIRLLTTLSEDNGQRLRLEIHDNGAGISPENTDKVFEPFFTTKDIGKGTGLGLYVSYMIIERLGGRISIENSEGPGARFIIDLPLTGPGSKTNSEKETSS